MTSRMLNRVRRNICALLLGLLVFSWADFIYTANHDLQATKQECHQRLNTHAQELEVHVGHLVKLLDIVIQEINQHLSFYSDRELLGIQKAWLQSSLGQASGYVIDLSSGEILFSSSGSLSLPKSFDPVSITESSGRAGLQIADQLYLGKDGQQKLAFYGFFKQSGRSMLTVFFVNADRFIDSPVQCKLAPGSSATLLFNDGEVLAGNRIWSDSEPSFLQSLLVQLRSGPTGVFEIIDAAGQSWIVAYRELPGLPFMITVTTEQKAVFAEWRRRFGSILLVQIVISLAVVISIVALYRSLARVKQVERGLVEREKQFHAMADSSVDAVISANESGRILFWSRGAENVFSCPAEEALQMPITCFLQFADAEKAITLQQLAEYHPSSRVRTLDVLGQRKNGDLFPTELSVSHSRVAGQLLYTLIVRDVTERKQAEDRIRRMASHDNLTGLPNRTLLMDRLQVAMAQVRRQGGRFALLFLDLDKFKPVNDNFGHEVGDHLLQVVASRMQDNVRASDTVARIGGDEFALVLNNIENESAITSTCELLLKEISREYNISGNRIEISASIGVVFFAGQEQNAGDLIRRADNAMYAAKRAGQNCYRIDEEHSNHVS